MSFDPSSSKLLGEWKLKNENIKLFKNNDEISAIRIEPSKKKDNIFV